MTLSDHLREIADLWQLSLLSKEKCLEAADILETLPLTADGEMVYPGRTVWGYIHGVGIVSITTDRLSGNEVYACLYSTKDAADQAVKDVT
jgi:hypothetical protein